MAENKRYFWLKLDENFFEDDTIAWIEEQENGKDYAIFYLKLALKSLKDDGYLIRYVGQKLIPYDVKALAKLTNTPVDTVSIAMKLFIEIGLVSQLESGELYLNQINEMIGSETRQASLMRKKRAKVNQVKERAMLEENHIPYIEDYLNNSRYGGNYYYVFNRDNQKCLVCESSQNLCVHHIIGFDKNDSRTTQMSSMVTLCRACHSKEHANPTSIITDDILNKVEFDMDLKERIYNLTDTHGRSNNVTESYPDVKKSYTDIEIEKDKELDKELDKDKEIEKNSTAKAEPPIPYSEIVDYLNLKTKSNFRSSAKETQRLIKARINDGFTLDDFKQVIDTKTNEWLFNQQMAIYLRPKTLFGTNFESYLNQRRQTFSNLSLDKPQIPETQELPF